MNHMQISTDKTIITITIDPELDMVHPDYWECGCNEDFIHNANKIESKGYNPLIDSAPDDCCVGCGVHNYYNDTNWLGNWTKDMV